MEAIKELQFTIEEDVFGLTVEELRQICPLLDISTTEGQTRKELIRLAQSFLRKMDTSQAGLEERLKKVKASLDEMKGDPTQQPNKDRPEGCPDQGEMQSLIDSHRTRMAQLEHDFQEKLCQMENRLGNQRDGLKEEPRTHASSIPNPQATMSSAIAPPLFRKELRISGQIGELNQKDRLSFTSLNHQMEAALVRGYNEAEVIEAVVRAINPGLRFRSYLENLPHLTLPTLRMILKTHFQEKDATEIYQELSQISKAKVKAPRASS